MLVFGSGDEVDLWAPWVVYYPYSPATLCLARLSIGYIRSRPKYIVVSLTLWGHAKSSAT